MYKSRFYLWLIILGVFFLFNFIKGFDMSGLIIKNTDIKVNVDTDIPVKTAIMSSKTKSLKLIQSTDNPSLIIKNNSNETIENYEKVSNAIYSPIVAYIPLDFDENSEYFYSLGGDAKFINFNSLAEAILEDKSIVDLGFSDDKKHKDTKVILNIPSKGTFYYDKVVEQIYIALNNNKIPTEEEKLILDNTVNTLLKKAVICNDVTKKIKEESNDESVYNVFIAPEFYMTTSDCYGITSGEGDYEPIYFEKTVILGYDMFIKNEQIGDVSLKELIFDRIIEEKRFIDSSKYRTIALINYDNLFLGQNVNSLDIVE